MPTVFFSYSHADEALRDELEIQLAMLKRQGLIETWHDRRIIAGSELDAEISIQIDQVEVILLLVSPDFLASRYCYDREMMRAMERHNAGDAVVIPVILRPCDWHDAPFGKLMATPRDGKPVTLWPNRDMAFLEVTRAIRDAIKKMGGSTTVESRPQFHPSPAKTVDRPRSSNMQVSRTFSDREKDKFKVETFEYMAKFFENSLEELERRNQDIETSFRKVDANRFTASIYRNGNSVAKCTIFMGGDSYLGGGICFIHGETASSSSYNESISVASDDVSMYLSSSGMTSAFRGTGDRQRLTQQGAAEDFWAMLIQPLQGRNR